MTLTPQARKALEYVRNSGGGATVSNFFEDHEPIGDMLWQEIRRDHSLVTQDRDGRLLLTEAGRAALDAPMEAQRGK